MLKSLASVTGAQLSNLSLFSLGLSPWMTAMIIWRFFTVVGWFKQATSAKLYYYQMVLSILIASMQAFGLTTNAHFITIEGLSPVVIRLVTIVILVAGAAILSWLGAMNGQKGLGGMMIIIVVNMIISFQQNLYAYFVQNELTSDQLLSRALIFLVIYALLLLVTVVLYRAEYRLPIKRIGINTSYNKGSYLPIRVTPAGAMPFMYGMTLMMLPPYLISIWLHFAPNNDRLIYLATNMGMSKLPGVLTYMVLLYILSIGFAYYNYDTYDIAKQMRGNGDYFEGIRPGLATQKFLQRRLNFLAHFGAMTVILIGAGPMVAVVRQGGSAENVTIAMLISNAYIISSLLLGIIEQVDTLRSWKNYRNLI